MTKLRILIDSVYYYVTDYVFMWNVEWLCRKKIHIVSEVPSIGGPLQSDTTEC